MQTIRHITTGRWLKLVLIAQALAAAMLILGDLDARWFSGLGGPGNLPSGPTAPGDQVRRYSPEQVRPSFAPELPPGLELPEDLPARLEFSSWTDANLGEVLLLNGPIEPGDAQRLEANLEHQRSEPLVVALNSPGGAVDEAIAIGRMVRELGADTAVLTGMSCASACPYILAGGIERSVSANGSVGLHQHYYDANVYLPAFLAVENIQRGQGRTMEYLIEMGVDPGVMLFSLQTPPSQIYVLLEEELIDSRLATRVLSE